MQLIVLSIPLLLLLKRTFLSKEDSILNNTNELEKDQSAQSGCQFATASGHLLKSKMGLIGLLLIVAGVLTNFSLVYLNQLPPAWFYTFPDVDQKNYYFGKYLAKTWTHLTVFVIGLLGGHICRSTIQLNQIRRLKANNIRSALIIGHHQQQQQLQQIAATMTPQQGSPAPSGSKLGGGSSESSSALTHGSTSTIMAMGLQPDERSLGSLRNELNRSEKSASLIQGTLTMAALVCMSAIVFSTFSWSTNEPPSALIAALYDCLSRLFWSIALVGLMIQLCLPDIQTNTYTCLAKVLSHPICIVLGRLSFLAYLISPYVNTFVLAVEEQSLFPSLYLIFHVIVGNIVITYLIAFILAIVIEQPIRRLVRLCRSSI